MIKASYVAPAKCLTGLGLTLGLMLPSAWADTTFSGEFGVEQRYFLQDGLYPTQPRAQGSLFVQPQMYTEWNDGYDSLVFTPFLRVDQEDSERTHFDIRELMYLHADDNWELRVGIGKVFWGQTESLHLVDIINQTDAVDSVDGEEKLGQPMISYTWLNEFGLLSAYVLPYFRERTFSGEDGRLRPPVPINTDDALYESSSEETNIDFAVRWQQSLDAWEVGLSVFHGTNREPELVASLDEQGLPQLRPFYRQITQVGVDLLNISGDWIWKFEAIYRLANSDDAITPDLGVPLTPEIDAIDYFAAVGGFEYTLVGFANSTSDLGVLMEYQYDEREDNFFAPAQNDLMVGLRWVLNDIDSTEVLVGVVQDIDDTDSRGGFIEASSRMTQNWRWRIDGYFFSAQDPAKPLFFVRRDDHIQFGVEYFF